MLVKWTYRGPQTRADSRTAGINSLSPVLDFRHFKSEASRHSGMKFGFAGCLKTGGKESLSHRCHHLVTVDPIGPPYYSVAE